MRKRAAALAAGRELFVDRGYARTSVDAVAARAGISKRTVYDYYRDKDGLFDAVLEEVATDLVELLRAAAAEELTSGRDLGEGLLAFARRVATATFASSEYRLLRQLTRAGRPIRGHDPTELDDLPVTLLTGRFRDLAGRGELRAPDPRRAAQHFVALTFLLALDLTRAAPEGDLGPAGIDAVLVDGVDAFLRAYHSRTSSAADRPGT